MVLLLSNATLLEKLQSLADHVTRSHPRRQRMTPQLTWSCSAVQYLVPPWFIQPRVTVHRCHNRLSDDTNEHAHNCDVGTRTTPRRLSRSRWIGGGLMPERVCTYDWHKSADPVGDVSTSVANKPHELMVYHDLVITPPADAPA